MHIVSFEGMTEFANKYAVGKKKVLDVGSCIVEDGATSYRQISNEWEYVGCDVQSGNNVNVVLENPYVWTEFDDNSFDIVISGQAFEHIEYPWLTIKEIARVLKPKGYCCIIAPARCPVHQHPVDTYRYNADGFIALAKWAGLEVVEIGNKDWKWDDDLTCIDTRLIARKP